MIIKKTIEYEMDESSLKRKDKKISLRIDELSSPQKAIDKCIFLITHIVLVHAHDDIVPIKFYDENRKKGFEFKYSFTDLLEEQLTPLRESVLEKFELITSIVIDIKKF